VPEQPQNHRDLYTELGHMAGALEGLLSRLDETNGILRGLDRRVAVLEEQGRKPAAASRPSTNQTNQAITDKVIKEVTGQLHVADLVEEALPSTVEHVATELEKRRSDIAKNKRGAAAQWVGIIVGALSILSMLGGAIMYMVHLSKRIDAQAQGQRVVYVHVPQAVDAGAPEPKKVWKGKK